MTTARSRRRPCGSNPIKEYIDRRPDLAGEIREVFPAMAMMEKIALAEESLAGDGTVSASPAESLPAYTRELGDFRILREVGHGGMDARGTRPSRSAWAGGWPSRCCRRRCSETRSSAAAVAGSEGPGPRAAVMIQGSDELPRDVFGPA